MSQEYAEEFTETFSLIAEKVKRALCACVENPSKLNDLRTHTRSDFQSLMDDLQKKFNGKSIDFQKLLSAVDRLSPKEYSEADTKVLMFMLEIFLKMLESTKP